MDTQDYGAEPYVVNIEKLTTQNDKFRVAKWTGKNLQMTVMSIPVGGEVGLEVHEDHDQFLRIEQGHAKVVMGPAEDNLTFQESAEDDFAIFVPANTWHNIINDGNEDLRLYSIYAPPEHAKGTIHETYDDAMAAEAAEHGE
jgi:mannose-6-phosphate isomerase-like protein (cupin superfamily)